MVERYPDGLISLFQLKAQQLDACDSHPVGLEIISEAVHIFYTW